jgi:hypothetical protein
MSARSRAFLIGGLGGALVGLIGARFYLRSARRHGRSGGAPPAPTELIKLGLSMVGILRQIAALGRMSSV